MASFLHEVVIVSRMSSTDIRFEPCNCCQSQQIKEQLLKLILTDRSSEAIQVKNLRYVSDCFIVI